MSALPDIFRANLKARIESLDLSYAEVGRRTGLDRSAVKQYVDGQRVPGLLLLGRFAEAVELTPAELLTQVEENISS